MLGGPEQGGTDLFPYPAAMKDVSLYGGDSDVVFLRLIAQRALEGGQVVLVRELWAYLIQGSWELQLVGLLAVTHHSAASISWLARSVWLLFCG